MAMARNEGALEARLSELEGRVTALQARVDRMESGAPAPFEEPPEAIEPVGSRLGAEYWIGARLLPRLGAVLIVLAIAFVAISETSKRPGVDRDLILAFEALLCLGFIAVGEWKRDELEGFGKTLSAIGAVGLYLTAAGGHFAYRTLTETGMASVFAMLSILTHGYAVWRNTRLFFVIGAGGGLVAMLYTLVEAEYATGLGVYTAVTVAAAAACAMRKWFQLAILGWLMGVLLLIPVMHSDFPRLPILGALYVGSLSCIGAAVVCYRGDGLDVWALGAPVSLGITAVLGFVLSPGVSGLAHLAALCAAGASVGWAVHRENHAGRALLVGSASTLGLLGPLCLPPWLQPPAYVAIAVVCVLLGGRIGRRWAAGYGLAGLFAGAMAYALGASSASESVQSIHLGALLLGVGVASLGLRAADWGWIGFMGGAAWAVVSRWSYLLAPAGDDATRAFSLPTTVSIVYAMGLLALGFRLRSSSLRLWSIGVMFASVVQILAVDTGMAVEFRLAALIALGGMMLVGGYRYVRERRAELAEPPAV